MKRTAWLEARKNGLGGSDAPIIMGASRWVSAHALFLEKVGLVEREEQGEPAYWGHALEKPVAKRYAQVTERVLLPGVKLYHSRETKYLFANTDRMIRRDDGRKGRRRKGIPQGACAVYEGKTVGPFMRPDVEEWESGRVPILAAVQLQHYLYVCEVDWGSFGVLVGGQKFLWMDMQRNDRFIKTYLKKAEEFWDRVQNNDPPPMEGHPSERRALDLLYPKPVKGKIIDLDAEAQGWSESLDLARKRESAAKRDKEMYGTLIRGAMGDALFGRLPSGAGFKLALEHRKKRVTPASSSRVLRNVKEVA